MNLGALRSRNMKLTRRSIAIRLRSFADSWLLSSRSDSSGATDCCETGPLSSLISMDFVVVVVVIVVVVVSLS